jgi:hypothetical protein
MGHFSRCPLHPRKRTSLDTPEMSAKCHYRKLAALPHIPKFVELVLREPRGRDRRLAAAEPHAQMHHHLDAITTPPSVSARAPHSRNPRGSPSRMPELDTPIMGTNNDPIVTREAGRRCSAANQAM